MSTALLVAVPVIAGVAGLRKFVQGYWYDRRCADGRLDGRVALVTGGNSGIGLHAAIGLAARGAKVVIACRSAPRALEAVDLIKQASGSSQVSSRSLDLMDLASVRRCAEQLLAEDEPLHLLVNNAGVSMRSRELTEDGLEATFQTNHLSHVLLTELLLPRLMASAAEHPARVVSVSSGAHARAAVRWDDLGFEGGDYKTLAAYGQSKLAQVLYTRALVRHLETLGARGVTAVSCTPGFVRTNIFKLNELSPLKRGAAYAAYPLVHVLSRSGTTGAQTVLHCCVDGNLTPGAYYSNCLEKPSPNPLVQDEEVCGRVRDVSLEMLRDKHVLEAA